MNRDTTLAFLTAVSAFLFAALFFARESKAAESEASPTHRAVVHLGSYHFDRSREWNEVNLGLGYRYQVNDGLSLQAGFYRNSYFRDTKYAIAQYEWATPVHGLRAGVFGGKVTGYDQNLAAGLMATYKAVTVRFVPPAGGSTTPVLSLELHKAF